MEEIRGGRHSIPVGPNRSKRWRKGKFLYLSWNIHLLLPLDIRVPDSQAFRLPLVFLGPLLTDSRLWDFLVSRITWANPS